jgi:RNA polymerase sigma factor (TIGR02999 family)
MASQDVTQLLQNLQGGDRGSFDVLLGQVYDELRRLAHGQLRNERDDHTLNTTGLVHEAYLRLVDHRQQNWKSRAHFFGAAAQAMRRILVDYARTRSAKKRSGQRVSLTDAGEAAPGLEVEAPIENLIEIDDALQRLAALNERFVRVVECRYFAGLTIEETAEALGVSHATVSDDWRLARAWLQRELAG